MIARGIIGMGLAGVLSACGGAQASGPRDHAVRQVPVMQDGVGFLADVTPGASGIMLVNGRAASANGLRVAVSRQGKPLGYDEGRLAKTVAQTACEGEGKRFNPAAHGRFAGAGVWKFARACA